MNIEEDNMIVCYIYPKTDHPCLNPMSLAVAEGFRLLGIEVFEAYLDDLEELKQAYIYMLNGNVDFCVGLNNMPDHLINGKGEYIFSNIDVPYVAIMLDPPYTSCVGNMMFPCKKHLLCVLDKSHVDMVRKLYPEKDFMGIVFLPLAGIETTRTEDVFSRDRKIDVAYCAGGPCCDIPKRIWHDNESDMYIKNILDDVADYLVDNTVSIADGFRHVILDRGFGEDVCLKFLDKFNDMFYYVKAVRRVKAIEFLIKNEIPVNIYGNGWEAVPMIKADNGKYARLHGALSYNEYLELIANTKVLYQDNAVFNTGAHERVFTSMLNGAVVVSEYSTYLDNEFIDGSDLFLYDWKNGMNQVQVINDLLLDESKRLSAAVGAYGKAIKRHCWKQRAERICEALSILSDKSFI